MKCPACDRACQSARRTEVSGGQCCRRKDEGGGGGDQNPCLFTFSFDGFRCVAQGLRLTLETNCLIKIAYVDARSQWWCVFSSVLGSYYVHMFWITFCRGGDGKTFNGSTPEAHLPDF